MYRVWYSTQDVAQWLRANTTLRSLQVDYQPMANSDSSNPGTFHRMPGHIKQILYLDAPDLIIEKEGEPLLAIEISKEAGTGHNAFQRFARIAAAVENGVPIAYIYPEAVKVSRRGRGRSGGGSDVRWDRINPLIFFALERLMQIYDVPALLYYHPTEYSRSHSNVPANAKGLYNDLAYPSAPLSSDPEMQAFFDLVNLVITRGTRGHIPLPLIRERQVVERRDWMWMERYRKSGEDVFGWSPLTATQTVQTGKILRYLSKFAPPGYNFGHLLPSRPQTVVYQVDARLRGDPYPGALAAIDYMVCRVGKTYEERDKNLVLLWGTLNFDPQGGLTVRSNKTSVNDFLQKVQRVRQQNKCLLWIDQFNILSNPSSFKIPRYYMQCRYGCTFTKPKEIRVYSFFADAMLFADGALWREG